MDASISCRLQHTNNEIIWKSEQKHQNGTLIWEQKGQNSEFLKKTEQDLLDSEFIRKGQHKEQNNKLIRQCQQSNKENKLEEAQQIVQVTKFTRILIGTYKKQEQNNKLILKFKQKGKKRKLFGKSEEKEQNRTCTMNSFLCYGMQNTASPCTHHSNGGFTCCPLFNNISSLACSDELLNELYVCEYSLLCDSRNIGIVNQTSFFSDDKTRLALKLAVIVWSHLPQNLAPLAASIAEDSNRNAREGCTAEKSDMPLFEMNSMNINRFNSSCKNSVCAMLDTSKLKELKRNYVYQRISGHNTKAISPEDTFLKGEDIFLKGCVYFSPGQRSCLKTNNNAMAGASYSKGKCYKYDLYIYIVSRHRAHTTSTSTRKGCVKLSCVPADADTVSLLADQDSTKRRSRAERSHVSSQDITERHSSAERSHVSSQDSTERRSSAERSHVSSQDSTERRSSAERSHDSSQDITERLSSAERSHVSSLNAAGRIRICLISVLSIDCGSAFISSMKEKNCLEMPLFLGDGVCLNILRFTFYAVFQGHEVTALACKQNFNYVSSNVSHPNKNKQFSYFFCQKEVNTFHNSTSEIHTNTPHIHHSHCSILKESRFIRLHHDRSVKLNGYRTGRVTFFILYIEMSIGSEVTRNEVATLLHHKLISGQTMCWKYSPKPCCVVSNNYFSYSTLCSQFGGINSISFRDMKISLHVPTYRPRHFLTTRNKANRFITIVGTFQHKVLASNQKDKTRSLPAVADESCLLEDHKKSNICRTIFRRIISTFLRKKRSRPIGKDAVEKRHHIITSAYVKGRQAMISNTATDLNQNSFRSETSEVKRSSAKSFTPSSVAYSDDDDTATDVTSEDDEEDDEFAKKSARIKSNIECMDNFLIVWHSGFLIMFMFLLGLGIVLRVYFSAIIERKVKSSANYVLYSHFVKIDNVPDKLEFGNLTEVLGESLIILSSLYIICIIFYMTFLIHRITFMIPLVVIVTGAVVLTEVNIINIYMSPVSAANEQAKKELRQRAEKEYAVDSNKPFAITYDLISIWGLCCGIVDQYDFQNVILKYFLPTKGEYKTLQVPPTCCEPSYFEKGVENVVDCASTAEGIFTTGCYQTIYIWLRLYCNLYSIVVILQLLDLCIHIILYKKHLSLLVLQQAGAQKPQIKI